VTATSALATAVAYLLGSIPFGLILFRVFRGGDIRESGSGNIGATNALRSGGVGLGVATLLLDVAKGAAGVLVARAVASGDVTPVAEAAFVAAPIVGHCFPVWLRFRGGKGVATALGVLAVAEPTVMLAAIALFALTMAVTRIVSASSVAAACAVIVAVWWTDATLAVSVAVVIVALVVVFRHKDNLRRLARGTEPRLGSRQKAGGNRPDGASS
jgi:glycerol-3-phosphate acyltransferase PlsY